MLIISNVSVEPPFCWFIEASLGALLIAVGSFFLLSFLWSFRAEQSPITTINSRSSASAQCSSPDCVRCNRYSDLLRSVPQRLGVFCTFIEKSEGLDRIERFVFNINVGDHQDLAEASTVYGACSSSYVLFIPGLEAKCWHDGRIALRNAVISAGFCESTTLECLREEFQAVWYNSEAHWQYNSTTGVKAGWRTLYLVNQGQRVSKHVSFCPNTTAALERVGGDLMRNCVFANACFSVLEPGAHITPHHGPCNVRIRCHIPLYTPDQCWLRVGSEHRCWSAVDGNREMGFFLFDDAFEHEVQHEGLEEDGARVIFMFDLWHPDLLDVERRAISYLFPPSMNGSTSSR